MKISYLTILLLSIGLNTLEAQDGQSSSWIKESHIKVIEAYYFKPNVTQDSSLITREEFNKEGRRTKIEIFDSLGLTDHYEYDYLFDTIKTERRTYYKGELKWVTKMQYNKHGNETSAIDYDAGGNESGMNSTHKYNDQQKLVEVKVFEGEKNIFHTVNTYYQNGNLKEDRIVRPKHLKRTIAYHENGVLKPNSDSRYYRNEEFFRNYKSSGITMKQVDSRSAKKVTTIGVNGRLDLGAFDMLRDQIFYLNNGLIDYELQFVNGKSIGMKKYVYFK